MAVENLVAFVQNFFSMLPVILQTMEIIVYVVLILFFGKIAVKGFRAKTNPAVKYLIIIFTGVLCLIASTGLSWIFSFANIDALQFFQIDTLLAGFVSSFIFALSFYFLTHGLERREGIQEIWQEIEKIKTALVKKKIIETLSEKDAKKKAEEATKGKAKKAELSDYIWKVTIEKGKKNITAFIDAFTGDVKEVLYHKSRLLNFFSDKFKLIGVVLLVFFTVFIMVNYKGLPSMTGTLNEMGLSKDVLSDLSAYNQKNTLDCVDLYTLTKEMSKRKPEVYTGSDIKDLIEAESGSNVISMSKMEYENKIFIFAITENDKMCYTQNGKFCGCFDF